MRLLPGQLLPQGQALRHAKAVLLVNHGQPQPREVHLLLDDGVRAHHQRRLARFNGLQGGGALFFLLPARQPRHALAARLQQGRKPLRELVKVLAGQNFRGRHQGALPARVHRHASGQRGHHRFARAHIALQQAVHGLGAGQIARNFFAHAALRRRQRKRQRRQQLLMQPARAHMQRGRGQRRALLPRAPLRKLLGQQLLGLQAQPGRMHALLQSGQRRIGRRLVQKKQRLAQGGRRALRMHARCALQPREHAR